MSQAARDVLRKALWTARDVLLCGRTGREEQQHRNLEDLSVSVVPLPAVPLSRLSSSMHTHFHAVPPSYRPSEEQALSIAIAQSVVDQAAWQAARASGSSQHTYVLKSSAGESLSRKLWQDGSLGYGDLVTDGFYDVYGDYPEVCEAAHEFPSLENLRKVRTGSGDVREVVLVDHELDQGLLQAEEMLSEAMAEANPQDVHARIRVVAHVVCDRFGGTYDSEAALEQFWQVSSAAEKRRNRSAVVLLCRLDVGSLRHRALLFKVLADAVKLPCKLIRGQVLCGADSAANAVVMAEGSEHVVDLVFDPGSLYSQEQFASIVQLRRLRLDGWQHSGAVSTAAATAVETSAVSASSTSSAGTPAGTTGFLNTASASNLQQCPASNGTGSAGVSSQTPWVPNASATEPLPAMNSSPRAAPARPHVMVPPVPAPGSFSSSLPSAGAGLHGQGGSWGLAPGHTNSNGPGPAIAGSRVRFTITDLPKVPNPQPHGGRVETRQGASTEPLPAASGPAVGAVPAPLPAPPGEASAAGAAGIAAAGASSRHNFMPGKAKSMVDLAATAQRGGDFQVSSSEPGSDLIRLDSEPLPDSVLHDALPPPERSGTPTGTSAPGARGPSALLGRRQNSFDQNGWVKFSGSFTRSKDDGKPSGCTNGLGLSPLGFPSGGRAAAAPSALPASISSAIAPPTPHTTGAPQSLELSTSLSPLGTAAPDGTRPGNSVGSDIATNAATTGATGAPTNLLTGPGAAGCSKVMTASAFAKFQLPLDLSAGGSIEVGPRSAGSAAAGSTGGSGSGLSRRTSHGGSDSSLQKMGHQPQAHGSAQHLSSQQQPQPAVLPPQQAQPRPSLAASSPFQAMQLGFAVNMPPSSLVSAFGVVPSLPQQLPQAGTLTHGPPTTHLQPQQQQQQQQAPSRPPHAPVGVGLGGGSSAAGANMLLPRMNSLPYTGQAQAPSQPQPPQSGPAAKQCPVINHDSTHRMYGLGNGAAPTASYYTPPKSTDGGGNGGSKAPSPALSTPFTVITASSAQSTPPGSAPPESVPFADLSPFNVGDAVSGCGSGRRDEKPERERERDQREREQRDWERDRERERERDRERSRAQSFFADLSPFNTSSGGGGSGEARDTTPARHNPSGLSSQQPIVEMPSSDNSREATPRVSLHSGGDTSGVGPSGVGQPGGVDVVVQDLTRMQLVPPAGSRPDSTQGRIGPMQQHLQQLQMQQAFGMMAALGPVVGASHMGQHLPQHVAMSYYAAAAMQGNPYMYVQQPTAMAAAAATAGMMPQGQGYVQSQPGAVAPGMQAWRQMYDPTWPGPWAAQQANPYMLQAAYMQEQQRQQQQAIMAAAAGMAGQAQPQSHPGGLPGLQGLDRRMSAVSSTATSTVQHLESGLGVAAQAPAAGTSAGSQLALPPSAQPHLRRPEPQMQQHGPQQPPRQQQQQQQPVDLAHEMTLPSQRRLEKLQLSNNTGQDAGSSTGQVSPLGLQPSLSVSMPLPPSYRDLEIHPEELKFGPRIGIGSYGEVYRGTWRGTEVAIKRFLEQNLSAVTIREFRDEVMIMSKLRHPNIVLFMGAVTQSNQLAIVTQFVARGSLFRMLHRSKEVLDPRRRLNMALDIAKGMEYLHNCKPVLVHRDLKSPNLLVDKDYTIKVCDFGLSQVKMNTFLTAKSQGGSPAWMAPEILRGEPCDEKSDVFSFGVILYELVTGKEPWEDLNPMQVVGAVGFSGRRMALPTDLDPVVTALIQGCWATSPKERPSFTQILATMTTWSELRPTAVVMQQQQEAAVRRQQRAAGV